MSRLISTEGVDITRLSAGEIIDIISEYAVKNFLFAGVFEDCKGYKMAIFQRVNPATIVDVEDPNYRAPCLNSSGQLFDAFGIFPLPKKFKAVEFDYAGRPNTATRLGSEFYHWFVAESFARGIDWAKRQ